MDIRDRKDAKYRRILNDSKNYMGLLNPLSCEKLWQDLSVEAQLREANPKLLLLALDFVWAYETEESLTPRYGMTSPKTCRKHIREYILKIQSILPKMVSYFIL